MADEPGWDGFGEPDGLVAEVEGNACLVSLQGVDDEDDGGGGASSGDFGGGGNVGGEVDVLAAHRL